MQRSLMKSLLNWKDRSNRKPLVLRGARQTGKTWLLQEFGKQAFSDSVYIRLEDNEAMATLFSGSLDPRRLMNGFETYSRQTITPSTLLILDEIQALPKAITALKYFNEEMPEYPIAVAGSLLGLAFHYGISFPVGKVDFLTLSPMTFTEFLLAEGQDRLCAYINEANFDMIDAFREGLTDLLRQYYYVGGMPEAVSEFSQTKNYERVREIQQSILMAYEVDFSKHRDKDVAERCRQVWQSIPSQLAKENKKFVYNAVKKGSRGRDYLSAIQFLADSGLIQVIPRVSKPGIPLDSYKDENAFKIYLVDIGLLGAMTDLDTRTLIEGNRLFEEFKGTYAEQYVAQQLLGELKVRPYYWSAEKSSGEIDFLFQAKGVIYPTEVKAAENLKSKSLAAFAKKYHLSSCIRFSLSSYRDEGWMQNIPLYAIGSVNALL
jgi:predicted AAA+ superfamily ATPase